MKKATGNFAIERRVERCVCGAPGGAAEMWEVCRCGAAPWHLRVLALWLCYYLKER